MQQELPKHYITSSEASARFGVTNDYVASLARQKKVEGVLAGRSWYVHPDSLYTHLETMQRARQAKHAELSKQLKTEYHRAAAGASKYNIAETFTVGVATFLFAVSGGAFTYHAVQAAPADQAFQDIVAPQWQPVRGLAAHLPSELMQDIAGGAIQNAANAFMVALEHAPSPAPLPGAAPAKAVQRFNAQAGGFAARSYERFAADFAEVQTAAVSLASFTDFFAGFQLPNIFAWFDFKNDSSTKVAGSTTLAQQENSVLAPAVPASSATSAAPVLQRSSDLAEDGARPFAGPALPALPTTVVQQVIYAGVSEETLAEKLSELSNSLRSLIYAQLSVPNSFPATGGVTNNIALTQRIDKLSGVSITNSTIDAASLPPLSGLGGLLGVGQGGLGTSTAPNYGQLLLGNANGGYDFVATSSLGFSTVTSLAALTDVSVPSPAWGDLLYYDGTAWSAFATSSLGISTSQWSTSGSNLSYTAGNVGIGTTTPVDKLDVAGNLAIGAYSGTPTLYFKGASNTNYIQKITTNVLGTDARWRTGIGTEAAPGWSFVGDPDTGIYQPGSVADTLGLVTGGSEKVRISSTGNVGIGTTTPNSLLTVKPTTVGDGIAVRETDDGFDAARLYAGSTNGFLSLLKGGVVSVLLNAGTNANSYFNSGGNVGIGTTSPYAKLSVVGEAVATNFTATSTTATSTIAGGLSVGGGALQYDLSSGVTSISNLSIGNLNFETNAGMVALSNIPVDSNAAAGVIQSQSINIGDTPVFTVYGESNGTGGVQNLRVGIGTTSPFAALAVLGQVVASYFTATTTATSTFAGPIQAACFTLDGNTCITGGGNNYASTTIGNGTQTGGLTINGGATTTGNLLVQGNNIYGSGNGLSLTRSGVTSKGFAQDFAGAALKQEFWGTGVWISSASSMSGDINNVPAGSLIVDGNVGIGTTSPGANLHIAGANNTGLRIGDNNSAQSTSDARITFYSDYENFEMGRVGYWGDGNLLIQNNETAGTTGSVIFGTSALERMRIAKNGNVGIGTTTPPEKLTVSGNVQIDSTSDAALFFTEGGTYRWTEAYSVAGDYLYIRDRQNSRDLLSLYDNGNVVFPAVAGNVGIGTTSPYAKLSVVGEVVAARFTATTTATSTFAGPIQATCFSTDGTTCITDGGGSSQWTTSGSDIYYADGKVSVGANSTPETVLDVFGDNGGDGGVNELLTLHMTNAQIGAGPGIVFRDSNYALGRINALQANPFKGSLVFETAQSGSYSESMRISDNGNVGIGTTTPGSRLAVVGANTRISLADSDASGQIGLDLYNSANRVGGLLIDTNSNRLDLEAMASGGASVGGRISLTSTGNVGIGTTSPWGQLSVNPNGIAGPAFVIGSSTATNFIVTNTGNVGIGTTGFTSAPLGRLMITGGVNPGIVITDNDDTQAWKLYNATNDFRISSDGADYLTVNTNGLVGIGTTTPMYSLEVGNGSGAKVVRVNGGASGSSDGAAFIIGNNSTNTGAVGNYSALYGGAYNSAMTIYSAGNVLIPSGNVGIGTTSPYAKLSVTNTGSSPSFLVEDETSPDATPFIIDASGYTGIGTAAPVARLTISDSGTGLNGQKLAIQRSGAGDVGVSFQQSGVSAFGIVQRYGNTGGLAFINNYYEGNAGTELVRILSNGNVGIGSTTPFAKLSVAGETVATNFTATSTTATSTIAGGLTVGNGALQYDYSSGVTSIQNLAFGSMNFDTDAGIVSWMDMPVTSNATAGTVESYTSYIDGMNVLTIYGESDGLGGVTNTRVGIGTTSPGYVLDVASSTGAGAVARFTNATGNCTINPTTTSLSCSSDERLKKNIVSIVSTSTLLQILALEPVYYNWQSEGTSSAQHAGFIAQKVEAIFPDLVSHDDNGYLGVNYGGFAPYFASAIQEIASIGGAFKDNLIAWLGNATNGITKIFAKEVQTDKLCVGSVCVTQEQFMAMVQAGNNQNVGAGQPSIPSMPDTAEDDTATSTDPVATSTPDTIAPTITLNGNSPATVIVGSTYADLGVTVSDDVSTNMPVYAFLDDGATTTPEQIALDTHAAGEHTIRYVVIDAAGNSAEATRTVTVQDPSALFAQNDSGTASSKESQ